MNAEKAETRGLTGNQLKLIALGAMTCDHIGALLVDFPPLRIIGRLAFPIFAYMIAEGCAHTGDRGRYLRHMGALALAVQLVYFFAGGSLAQCVLVTFTLSIALIGLLDRATEKRTAADRACALLGIWGAYFLCEVLPGLLPGTNYSIEYSFWGVMLPVMVYFSRGKGPKLLLFTLGIAAVNLYYGGVQWFALAAVPLVALYNGRRGRKKLKSLFYLYYPAHLAALWLIRLAL